MVADPAPGAPAGRRGRRLREQRRTRRRWLVPVVAVVLVAGLVAGALALRSGDPAPVPPAETPVSADLLVGPDDLQPLAPQQTWRVEGTGDNTSGDGLNSVCQQDRFADPRGEGALVRRLATEPAPATSTDGAPARTVVESVEVSTTTQAASDAYRTTLGWYAGCQEARLRVADAWRVEGLGARSQVLLLQAPAAGEQRNHVVSLARTDRVTVSLVVSTQGGPPVDVTLVAGLLRTAVARLCVADAAGFCPGEAAPTLTEVAAPPTGDSPGALAVADLPPVGQVDAPWVGTTPVPAQPNLAATACDDADFLGGGAPDATSRSFVIPEADLPPRFGLTQTTGTFPGRPRATALVDGVVAALAGCEDDDLGAQVTASQVTGGARRSVALWRLEQEVDDDRTISSWMGVARVGRHVTQVLFTPAGRADLDEPTFRVLMDRAADRLAELDTGTR